MLERKLSFWKEKHTLELYSPWQDIITKGIQMADDQTNSCNRCSKKFPTKPLWKEHMVEAHDIQVFTCDLCPKTFYNNEEEFIQHFNSQHRSQFDRHTCTFCGATYKWFKFLHKHIKDKHEIEKLMECNECGEEFYNSSAFKNHMKLKHGQSSQWRFYKCAKCHRKFTAKELVTLHDIFDHSSDGTTAFKYYAMTHLGKDNEYLYESKKCVRCNLEYSSYIYLMKHIKSAHSKQLFYVCCRCDDAYYNTRAGLSIHMHFEHKMPRDHKCNNCTKAYTKLPVIKKTSKGKSTANSSINHKNDIENKPITPWAKNYVRDILPEKTDLSGATEEEINNLRKNIRNLFHILSTVVPSKLRGTIVEDPYVKFYSAKRKICSNMNRVSKRNIEIINEQDKGAKTHKKKKIEPQSSDVVFTVIVVKEENAEDELERKYEEVTDLTQFECNECGSVYNNKNMLENHIKYNHLLVVATDEIEMELEQALDNSENLNSTENLDPTITERNIKEKSVFMEEKKSIDVIQNAQSDGIIEVDIPAQTVSETNRIEDHPVRKFVKEETRDKKAISSSNVTGMKSTTEDSSSNKNFVLMDTTNDPDATKNDEIEYMVVVEILPEPILDNNEDSNPKENATDSQEVVNTNNEVTVENPRVETPKLNGTDQNNYKCEMCQSKFADQLQLLNHLTEIHTSKAETSVEVFKCITCGDAFQYETSLNDHMKKHYKRQNEENFECNVCAKKFRLRKGLALHKLRSHKIKTYACKVCDCEFTSPVEVKSHDCTKTISEKEKEADAILNEELDLINANETIEKLQINTLDKENVANLVSNNKTEESKQIKDKYTEPLEVSRCDKCPAVFKNEDKLKQHLLKHDNSGTKALPVLKIKKSDLSPPPNKNLPNLMSNILSSTILSPTMYACKICFSYFPTKELLKRHIQWEHTKNVNLHKCGQCGLVLYRVEDLALHMNSSHKQ